MVFRGKIYTWIFWDWYKTLYDPESNSLYPWVKDFLNDSMKTCKQVLISRSVEPNNRMQLLKEFGVEKYFIELKLGLENKVVYMNEVIEKYGINKKEILVIGDNYDREIAAAEYLGLDSVHIDVFTSELLLS